MRQLLRFGAVSDRTDWLALTGFLVELFAVCHFRTHAEECHPLGSVSCENRKLPMPDWLNKPYGTSTRCVPKNAATPERALNGLNPQCGITPASLPGLTHLNHHGQSPCFKGREEAKRLTLLLARQRSFSVAPVRGPNCARASCTIGRPGRGAQSAIG
jgi:hypothetical protein